MNVLALECCFQAVSVAVRRESARGDSMIREAYEDLAPPGMPTGRGAAERLVFMIDEVMTGAGITFSEVDRIAVTVGPGHFTGLRTGLATARGLALAAQKPIVGMTSLAVMMQRADLLLGVRRGTRPILVAIDARRDMLYVQLFGADAFEVLSEPALLDAKAAATLCAGLDVIVVGSGAELVKAAADPGARLTVHFETLQPHARILAQLAPLLTPLDQARPLYLRAADAKPPSTPPLTRIPT
jgi:tRNA threonylcarbamoyl adenosine modification protein YeaZ